MMNTKNDIRNKKHYGSELFCLASNGHLYCCIMHGENKLHFDEMIGFRFVLDQHTELDFYSASSLKQQPAGRYVAPLGNIILIPSQPVIVRTPYCYRISSEARHTNFIVFGLNRPRLEHTLNHTRDEITNHYTINAVIQDEK